MGETFANPVVMSPDTRQILQSALAILSCWLDLVFLYIFFSYVYRFTYYHDNDIANDNDIKFIFSDV